MSNQIRPGARGGRDQFSWDKVKEDKQRSNYLGSSIHGLPDKFKKGAETFWYTKETKSIPVTSAKEEVENIKNKEKKIMEALLGGSINAKKRIEPACKDENNSMLGYRTYRQELGRYSKPRENSSLPEIDEQVYPKHTYNKSREYSRYRHGHNSKDDSRGRYTKSPRRNRSRSP